MKRSAILRYSKYSKFKVEQHFEQVDKSVFSAEKLAWQEEADLHKHRSGGAAHSALEKIAATPELADVVLELSTKLGKEIVMVRPTSGNPTGLTELHQYPTPRPTLLKIYDHTIALLEEKYPKDSVYRTSVESLTKARRAIVAGTEDIDEIEQKVGSGLVEEILIQAAEEFRLAEELAGEQVWGELEEKPVEGQWTAHAFKDQPEGLR